MKTKEQIKQIKDEIQNLEERSKKLKVITIDLEKQLLQEEDKKKLYNRLTWSLSDVLVLLHDEKYKKSVNKAHDVLSEINKMDLSVSDKSIISGCQELLDEYKSRTTSILGETDYEIFIKCILKMFKLVTTVT